MPVTEHGPAANNERRGLASPRVPPMPFVGHVVWYPSGPRTNLNLPHRTIVAAISEKNVYLVSVCTRKSHSDPTCTIQKEHLPGAGLEVESFVSYKQIYRVSHKSYDEMIKDPKNGGFICETPERTLVRVLEGLKKSPLLGDVFRHELFMSSTQPEFVDIAGDRSVQVEKKRRYVMKSHAKR